MLGKISKNKRKISQQTGFTLIEAFAAISVLLIAVLGPLTLLTNAITDGNFAKNQITAYYLAQEALDATINLRDVSRNNGDPDYFSTLINSCTVNIRCNLDFQPGGNLTLSSGAESGPLKFNGDTGVFSSNEPSQSIFYRQVYFVPVTASDGTMIGARVVSIVKWKNKIGTPEQQITLTTSIFNLPVN